MHQLVEAPTSNTLSVVPDKPSSELTLRQPELLPSQSAWLQMSQMALATFKSGLMPDGIRNSEAALTTALKGYELGVPFMAAIEGIHIIKGKATVGAHLMLALIKRAYGGQAIRVAKTDAVACTIEYREPGWDGVASFSFTFEDAERAGLTGGDNWKKYPPAMLRARAISAVGKMAFPEVVGGLYVAGELGDAVIVTEDGDVVPDMRAVNATVVEQPAPARSQPAQRQAAEIQDAEIREVPDKPMTWTDLFNVLRPAKNLASKNAVAKHLGRDSIEGLSPQEVLVLVMGEGALAPEPNGAPASGHPGVPGSTERKPPPGIKMTDKQWWKLWACANEKMPGQADPGLHAMALESYDHASLKDVTGEEASKLIDFLERNSTDEVMRYVGPLLRQQAIERGQQELPIEGSAEIGPDEAALINFRERAEAGGEWLALLEEAGDREDYLAELAATSTTIGQLTTVVQRAKERGRYTPRFIAAERAVRPALEQRAAAHTNR